MYSMLFCPACQGPKRESDPSIRRAHPGTLWSLGVVLVVATGASVLVASEASPAHADPAPSRPLGLSTVAGSGQKGTVDGTGAAALFHSPRDVAVHPNGSAAYVIDDGGDDDTNDGTDTTPDSIRRVDLATGEVITLSQGGLLDEPDRLDVDARATSTCPTRAGGCCASIRPGASPSSPTGSW